MNQEVRSANQAWLHALSLVLAHGERSSPRGMGTIEYPHLTSLIDMHHPVVTIKERALNYRFMAAEAYWILSGDDTVEGIVPYNSQLLKFSDDGVNFAGAYGPQIELQLGYVITTLLQDQDSRQAGLTIWKSNPPKSKDIPCTVAIWFQLRKGCLNVHVFMRSNDLWLGYPYDVFNFSMLGHYVAGSLNNRGVACRVGILYHTAVSAHLYDLHLDEALKITAQLDPKDSPVPTMDPRTLMEVLSALRERGHEYLRWW